MGYKSNEEPLIRLVNMTGTMIFLTGGTGRTSTRIASRLKSLDVSVLLASRKGQAGVPTGYDGDLAGV